MATSKFQRQYRTEWIQVVTPIWTETEKTILWVSVFVLFDLVLLVGSLLSRWWWLRAAFSFPLAALVGLQVGCFLQSLRCSWTCHACEQQFDRSRKPWTFWKRINTCPHCGERL